LPFVRLYSVRGFCLQEKHVLVFGLWVASLQVEIVLQRTL
jgi:hypothetical protein